MERLWPRLRWISLLAAGSVLVHELRYVAGYGGNAGEALAEQGHSYMPWLEALACVLLLAAAWRFTCTLVRASRGIAPGRRAPRFGQVWVASTLALAGTYTAQEGFEGTFAPGHPAGLVGVFGHGGWTALLFAALVGAVIGAITRLAHRAIERVAARAAGFAPVASPPPPRPVTWLPSGRRLDVLAWNLAGRAPPQR
jgi:hypothetical protein